MSKAELRKIYQQWVNEEIEAIEVIEAVGKYVAVTKTVKEGSTDE